MAMHSGGGGSFAHTVVNSHYYIDALATLTGLNHSVFARQTLAGGNYELLRCSTGQLDGTGCDLEPREPRVAIVPAVRGD